MLSKILVVLSLKIQCQYKEKYFLIYTSMRNLFNVKRRQDHFYLILMLTVWPLRNMMVVMSGILVCVFHLTVRV